MCVCVCVCVCVCSEAWLHIDYFMHTVPTAAPEDVSVEAPSSTTLSIEWMPPPQDDQNGIVRSYVVRVLEVVTSTTLTYNTTEESLTVGFLHPHYQYEVSVAAVTVGQGPFSDSVTIQTPQDGEQCCFYCTSSKLSVFCFNFTSSKWSSNWD